MIRTVGFWIAAAGAAACALVLLLLLPQGGVEAYASPPAAPVYGDAFWETWGDGQAELAGYEMTYPRYGERRDGTAVAVFVTETFAEGPRVKHERGDRPADGTFPVMKLNLMQDFPTGIYDYNLMTSVFVALAGSGVGRQGYPTKVSFSSQEWCGHAYSQLVFDPSDARFDSHSYFDGEADERETLSLPEDWISEDGAAALGQGLTAPCSSPAKAAPPPAPLARDRPSRPRHALLRARHADPFRRVRQADGPGRSFEVERFEVVVEGSGAEATYPPGRGERMLPTRRWTFWVERSPERRLIRWERDDGLRASLLASTRAAYWALNGPGLEKEVERLGLRPRPPRTP